MKNDELKIKISVDYEPLNKVKKVLDECKGTAKALGLSRKQIRKLFNNIISTEAL
jgi:uncharacterized protein (DUF111 family)